MKIRTGFVSNSSSSNFVIDKSHKTVFDLAKDMLIIRNNDYKDWSETNRIIDTPEINNIDKAIRDGKDPNSSIYFTTCNYNTFIQKVEDYYIVTTCNNHPFVHDLKGGISCPEEVREWLKEKGYLSHHDGSFPFTEEIDSWKFQSGEKFWSPKYDLEISRYDYMEAHRNKDKDKDKDAPAYCKDGDHFTNMMVLASTGEIICPICYSRKRDDNEPGIDNRFDILDL